MTHADGNSDPGIYQWDSNPLLIIGSTKIKKSKNDATKRTTHTLPLWHCFRYSSSERSFYMVNDKT